MIELPLRRFRDELGTGEHFDKIEGFVARRGRSAESQAADYLIEYRRGPRALSINHPDRMAIRNRGMVHPTEDVEATCDAIELAAREIPAAWRGSVLVAVAWGIGPAKLGWPQDHPKLGGGLPFLARAGFSVEMPKGLTWDRLAHFARRFRAALEAPPIELIIEAERQQRGPRQDEPGPRERRLTREETMAEDRINGLAGIAKRAELSERTMRRLVEQGKAPFVHQRERGAKFFAYGPDIDRWKAGQRRGGGSKGGEDGRV